MSGASVMLVFPLLLTALVQTGQALNAIVKFPDQAPISTNPCTLPDTIKVDVIISFPIRSTLQLNLRSSGASQKIKVRFLRRGPNGQPIITKESLGDLEDAMYQDVSHQAAFDVICNKRNTISPFILYGTLVLPDGRLYKMVQGYLPFYTLTEQQADEDEALGYTNDFTGSPRPVDPADRITRRIIQSDVYIDCVALIEYTAYQIWFSRSMETTDVLKRADAINQIRVYFAQVFNTVDVRFKTASDKINIRLVGYVIEDESQTWFNDIRAKETDPTIINAKEILLGQQTLEQTTTGFPVSDHLVSFTAEDMYSTTSTGGKSTSTVGLAWVGVLCEDRRLSYSTAEVRGQFTSLVKTTAHEIAHSLSVQHDGKVDPNVGNDCSSADNYIMASPPKTYSDTNPYHFSTCSQAYMETHINSLLTSGSNTEKSCLLDSLPAVDMDDVINVPLPGQLEGLDKQCENMVGDGSYHSRGFLDASEICLTMHCRIPGSTSSRIYPAARGTTCGNKKWCIDGQCVFSEDAPATDDLCVRGDEPGACPETLSASSCQQDYWLKRCCATCNTVKCGGLTCNTGYVDSSTCQCVCPATHVGTNCETPVTCASCQNGGTLNSDTCQCTCLAGWTGNNCETKVTCASCQNGGTLNSNTCQCSCLAGWTGNNCETKVTCASCQNGGTLNSNTCQCTCLAGWTGNNCETKVTCASCQNGGTLNSNTCQCTCLAGWTGNNCETPVTCASCQNGGTLNSNTCQCSCLAGWTGNNCETKVTCASCQNGGTLNSNTCQCSCLAGWTGNNCETKVTCASCQNGGTLNSNTCQCSCLAGWTGNNCETPVTCASCQNGGTLNSNTCQCSCLAGWTGNNCETPVTCASCQNGGTLNSNTCQCTCLAGWTGNNCETKVTCASCQNVGTLNSNTCQCSCLAGWTGNNCETPVTCASCQNEGTLNSNTCQCSCLAGWTGNNCETPITCASCQNGGTLNSNTCQCTCLAGWTGNNCETKVTCASCQNGGTLNSNTCQCSCLAGWTGNNCESPVTCASCQNGGTLNSNTCQCSCLAGWTGNNCETKVTCASCQNGGTLNSNTCQCSCLARWTGNNCETEIPCGSCLNGGTANTGDCSCSCPGNFVGNNCEICSSNCPSGQKLQQGDSVCVCVPASVDCTSPDPVWCQIYQIRHLCLLNIVFMTECPNTCRTCVIQAPNPLPPLRGYS